MLFNSLIFTSTQRAILYILFLISFAFLQHSRFYDDIFIDPRPLYAPMQNALSNLCSLSLVHIMQSNVCKMNIHKRCQQNFSNDCQHPQWSSSFDFIYIIFDSRNNHLWLRKISTSQGEGKCCQFDQCWKCISILNTQE